MTAQKAVQITSDENRELASTSATELAKFLKEHPGIDRAQVKVDGHDLVLPADALRLLKDLLSQMASGNGVSIIPKHAELTTQEAANMLNVSRPYLVKLLEDEVIPFTKTGTHRRVKFSDLVAYMEEQQKESGAALDALVETAQELDMGY